MGMGGAATETMSEYDKYWCPASFIDSALVSRTEFEASLKLPTGERAMLERAARGIPNAPPGAVKAGAPLAKSLLKAGGLEATDSIKQAFAADEDFLSLSAVCASTGARKVAEKMAKGFLLALMNPTTDECKVSLQSTMDEMARVIRPPGAVSVDSIFGVPLSSYTSRITKPMVQRADSATLAAIMTAFGGEVHFATLVRKEVQSGCATQMAAQLVVDEFLLDVPNPRPAEILMSLDATVRKHLKEGSLPTATPLSKAVIKKAGPDAVSSIIATFGSSSTFKALAAAEMADELSAFVMVNGIRGAAVSGAYKMAQGFLLAAPNPGEAEVMCSLKATLDELAR